MVMRQRGLVKRWQTALVVVVLLLAMSVGGTFLVYHTIYHSFAFWSAPHRITYCDREYQDDATSLTRVQIDSQPVSLPGDSPYQLTSIGDRVPLIGWHLWAKITPKDRRSELGLPCTMELYLQQGPDSYRSYSLIGGP